MSDKPQNEKAAEVPPDWSSLWHAIAESSNRVMETWSGSLAPFMMSRVAEKATGNIQVLPQIDQ